MTDTPGLPASIPETLTPTATSTDTPSPTPTNTPVHAGGLITYQVQSGAGVSIYLQASSGAPIALISNQGDARILDFTPQQGGLLAIWTTNGGRQELHIIRSDGSAMSSNIFYNWSSITDANWSIDGQRLVVEALIGDVTRFYYFDAFGNLVTDRTIP